MNVHNCIIHKSQKSTTQVLSTDGWINKIWYIHNNGILFNHKEKKYAYNMNEPQKHAEWNKPDTKYHTFHLYEMSRIG